MENLCRMDKRTEHKPRKKTITEIYTLARDQKKYTLWIAEARSTNSNAMS